MFSPFSSFLPFKARPSSQGFTRKGILLESVPLGVTTWTVPLMAPVGTMAVIAVPVKLTVNEADVPLNVTLVLPVRLFPRILTNDPTLPEVGRVSTNGPRLTARLNAVPQPYRGQ